MGRPAFRWWRIRIALSEQHSRTPPWQLCSIDSVAVACEVAVMLTVCPGGGTSGALYMPCAEMLPRLVVTLGKFLFVTLQLTGTMALVAEVAVH